MKAGTMCIHMWIREKALLDKATEAYRKGDLDSLMKIYMDVIDEGVSYQIILEIENMIKDLKARLGGAAGGNQQ